MIVSALAQLSGDQPPSWIRAGKHLLSLDRKPYLDGLRGVAAMVVFIGHLLLATFDAFWIFNGRAAVCVFFVLSGFVLADLVSRSRLSLLAQVLRRYLRLVVPMLLTSAFAWTLLVLNCYRNAEAATITGSSWLAPWYQFDASFTSMVWEAVYGVFATGASAYNSNLWTMRPELVGSVLVFAIGSFFTTRLARTLCYIAHAAWFWSDYVMLFSIGALFFHFQAELYQLMRSTTLRAATLLIGLFLFVSTDKVLTRLHLPAFDIMWRQELSAILVVAAFLTWPLLQRWIGGAIGRMLGRISFTLYLIHVPIICSMTSWLILALPHSIAVPASIVLTIAIVIGTSYLLHWPVDQWPTVFSRAAGMRIDDAIKSTIDSLKRRYAAILE